MSKGPTCITSTLQSHTITVTVGPLFPNIWAVLFVQLCWHSIEKISQRSPLWLSRCPFTSIGPFRAYHSLDVEFNHDILLPCFLEAPANHRPGNTPSHWQCGTSLMRAVLYNSTLSGVPAPYQYSITRFTFPTGCISTCHGLCQEDPRSPGHAQAAG